MKLKLDENLGQRGADLFCAAGHDVASVSEQHYGSAVDQLAVSGTTGRSPFRRMARKAPSPRGTAVPRSAGALLCECQALFRGSRIFFLRMFLFEFFLIYRSSRGCGNCGKLGALVAESFPSLVGTGGTNWNKQTPLGTGLPPATASTARKLGRQQGSAEPLEFSVASTTRETDCYAWHGTATVALY